MVQWATIVNGMLTPEFKIVGDQTVVNDEHGFKHVFDINTGIKQTG